MAESSNPGQLILYYATMKPSPIYTTEPMVTRALAAEIRQDSRNFLELLRRHGGAGPEYRLDQVTCEATANVDIFLEFRRGDESRSVGIEAKFNHELTHRQISQEDSRLDQLYILVSERGAIPSWLNRDFSHVGILTWDEVLACFKSPRITPNDIATIKLSKVAIEAKFNQIHFEERLPGWSIETKRNGNGNPSITIHSPSLRDGRTLCGQIQVAGRKIPDRMKDVKIEGFIGISVNDDKWNFFNPEERPDRPAWVEHLKTLQSGVLETGEFTPQISLRAPGVGGGKFGHWKKPLAEKHLGQYWHLAKGYTDWAIGPKTVNVPLDDLETLADTTAQIFKEWLEVESKNPA